MVLCSVEKLRCCMDGNPQMGRVTQLAVSAPVSSDSTSHYVWNAAADQPCFVHITFFRWNSWQKWKARTYFRWNVWQEMKGKDIFQIKYMAKWKVRFTNVYSDSPSHSQSELVLISPLLLSYHSVTFATTTYHHHLLMNIFSHASFSWRQLQHELYDQSWLQRRFWAWALDIMEWTTGTWSEVSLIETLTRDELGVMRAADWKWIKAQLGFYRWSSTSLSVGPNWRLWRGKRARELGIKSSYARKPATNIYDFKHFVAEYSSSILGRSLKRTQCLSPTKAECSFVWCKEWSVWSEQLKSGFQVRVGVADADAAVLISTNVASTCLPLIQQPGPDEAARNRDPIPDTPQPPSQGWRGPFQILRSPILNPSHPETGAQACGQ